MEKQNNFRKNAHAVIIGIDKYQDSKIPDLMCARADARGIYDVLTDPELGRIHPDNVILLLDEQATQVNIRTAISHEIPRRADAKDMVFIYYAGHGAPVIDPRSQSQDGIILKVWVPDVEVKGDRSAFQAEDVLTGAAPTDLSQQRGLIDVKQIVYRVMGKPF